MQAWTAAIGGMVVMLISLAIESGQVASTLHTPWQGWSAMIYTTVISSLFGYGGLYFLLRRYSVSIVTPFATLTPIFAVLGGVALMGDQLTPRMMLGGLVTLIGVLIVSLREAPQPASLT